jgi:K+-sensing histidine kinase KdpD
MKALQKEAQRKSLELGVSVLEQLPTLVKGDGDQFKQVLAYLTSNAFRQSTSAVVEVSIIRTKDTTSVIGITVQDAGPGLTESELDVNISFRNVTKLTLSRTPSKNLSKLKMTTAGSLPRVKTSPTKSNKAKTPVSQS